MRSYWVAHVAAAKLAWCHTCRGHSGPGCYSPNPNGPGGTTTESQMWVDCSCCTGWETVLLQVRENLYISNLKVDWMSCYDRFNISFLCWKIFAKSTACRTLWMCSAMYAGLAVGTNKASTCLLQHISRGISLAVGFSANIDWQYGVKISWLYFFQFWGVKKKVNTEVQTSVGKNRDKKRGGGGRKQSRCGM